MLEVFSKETEEEDHFSKALDSSAVNLDAILQVASTNPFSSSTSIVIGTT